MNVIVTTTLRFTLTISEYANIKDEVGISYNDRTITNKFKIKENSNAIIANQEYSYYNQIINIKDTNINGRQFVFCKDNPVSAIILFI